MSSNEGKKRDPGEEELAMKMSQDSLQLPPSASTCQTCHKVASIRSFQKYPHFRFLCACGDNNFDGCGGQHHSGERGAVLESEKSLKTSIDEEGSKPTIDWTCKTCHQLASFKYFQFPFQSHPSLRFICACRNNNFNCNGVQHHSGESSAALESERKLKTSIDEKGNRQPENQGSGISLTSQILDSKTGGGPGEGGQGGRHYPGEGGAVLESEQTLKTSIDEIGNRQTEIQGSSTSSITQISDSKTGGGPGEGGQGGQGDGFKGNRQPEIQKSGTSSTVQNSDSEAGGGPGQDRRGGELIREGIACPKRKDPVLHWAHRFEILKRELDQEREGGKGRQGDEKGNRQPETQGSDGTSSTTQILDSETGSRLGEGEQGGPVMRKEIIGQKFRDPVLHQPHLRYWILARQLDQDREGGKGRQGDEKGNRQPETQRSGTSSTAQILHSGTGGGPGEGLGQGGQVMRKDVAGQQFKDPELHEPIRFQIQKWELDQDREGGRGGQGDEKGNRQPETQESGSSLTTQILDSGTGGGPGEGLRQGGQVMRKDIAGQQFKDPVLHQAKRFQIQKRELRQDREGGQGGQGDEKGNRQPETQESGTSSTRQILDSGTGGGPGEGGQGGQVMRKDIAGQQFKDPVLHQAKRFQIQKRELRQDREGGQGGQGDEKGNRQPETQESGTSSTRQILDSGTGGGPGEGGQGGQVMRKDIAGQQFKDPVLHQPIRSKMSLQRELDRRIRRYLQSVYEDREGGQGGQGEKKGNRQSETQGSGISMTTQILDSGTGGGPGEVGKEGKDWETMSPPR